MSTNPGSGGVPNAHTIDIKSASAVAFGPAPVPEPDPTAAAFFDIDNTVMRGASGYHLARGMAKAGLINWSDMLRFGVQQAKYAARGENLDDIATAMDRALSLVEGHHIQELSAIGEGVFEQHMVDRLWPGTLAIAQSHLDAGQQVWLVSATPIELAEVMADRLGLSGALATRAETTPDGFYTGRLDGPSMHGQVKADAIAELAAREGLELRRCSAYSDSANDIPMLSIVGYPCAVNPDRKLREHARSHGWQVRDFRSHKLVVWGAIPTAATLGMAGGIAIGYAMGRAQSVAAR